MTIVISHHIIQGKSILTGHIVDHCISVRISSHMPGSSFYHLLVTFQEAAHILKKSGIILSHTFLGRFLLSPDIPFIKSVEHQLAVTKNTILHQKLYRCSISQHMKSIHMKIQFPGLQCPKSQKRVYSCRKIHLQNTGNSGFMHCLYQMPELLCGIIRCTVRTLWCHIIPCCISPIIHLFINFFL